MVQKTAGKQKDMLIDKIRTRILVKCLRSAWSGWSDLTFQQHRLSPKAGDLSRKEAEQMLIQVIARKETRKMIRVFGSWVHHVRRKRRNAWLCQRCGQRTCYKMLQPFQSQHADATRLVFSCRFDQKFVHQSFENWVSQQPLSPVLPF